jgi:hypothetical protein
VQKLVMRAPDLSEAAAAETLEQVVAAEDGAVRAGAIGAGRIPVPAS